MNFTPRVHHVELIVQSLNKVIPFYKEVLGFHVQEKENHTAEVSVDGKESLLKLIEQPNAIAPSRSMTGLYHIAFLLPKRKDLADFTQSLVDKQVPVQGASDHHVSEALYLADPEGNGIEIYIDRSAEQWKWQGGQVYMTTEPLDVHSLLSERTSHGWSGMPVGTTIGHIHLKVADLKASEDFYCDLLGFDPILKYGQQALFLSKDRYHHHIGLNTWESVGGSPAPVDCTGLRSFTIKLDMERMELLENLLDSRQSFEEVDKGILINDPAGIQMMILFS